MTSRAAKLSLLLLFAAAIIALRFAGVGDLLTFENIRKHRDTLALFVHNHRAAALFLYVLAYICVTALSIPGAAVMTVAGGYLFGVAAAVAAVDLGATMGAALAFLSARHLLGARLQQAYALQLRRFNEELDRNGRRYLLTLRFIPVFPFFLVNFLSGLTSIPLKDFLWTTAVGILPGTAVFAFAGMQLETIRTAGDILSGRMLLALVILALFTLLPALFRRAGRS